MSFDPPVDNTDPPDVYGLRKAFVTVCAAMEKTVADDLAKRVQWAGDEIEYQRTMRGYYERAFINTYRAMERMRIEHGIPLKDDTPELEAMLRELEDR